jgi:hypothetical protein
MFLLGAILIITSSVCSQTPFTKVTSGPVVNDSGTGAGIAWADFHNDGLLDLFVANWEGLTNDFYRNTDNGIFTTITAGAPLQDADYHIAAVAADYDNDGYPDLLVSAGVGALTARRSLLYHNNGDGILSLVSGGEVTNQLGYFGPAAWGDYDNDGLLDLFITDHGDSNDHGGRNLLFHNNGDGTFTRVSSGAVVTDISSGYGAMWVDYDNDGFPDLMVVNNSSAGNDHLFLYHNERNGNFTRVLTNAVATDGWATGAQCATWGDYDNDGFPDLFVTGNSGTTDTLYHNNGDGTFTADASGPMSLGPNGNGCAWGDYDNDGYLDLVITSCEGNNRLFHNNGDGSFTEITSGAPVDDGGPGFCGDFVSWVDYNNDGYLDLFITVLADRGLTSNLLYQNTGTTNAWLELRLIGMASNRSAIGAKVHVNATIGGQSMWQLREISHGGGRWVQPLVAHFGLGDATNADTVRIEWPSGIVQTLTNVAARQILTVVEHQSGVTNTPTFTAVSHASTAAANLSASGQAGLLYLFEGSTNLTNWAWLGVRSNATGTVQFTDSRATKYPSRFYRVSIP